MKTMSLKHALWRYLKRFGTAEKSLKACILTLFETIWKFKEFFKNNVFKACILMVFETNWNCREIGENNVSKACILVNLKRF